MSKLKIEYIPLTDIKPYEHNAKRHPRSCYSKGWKQSLDWIRKNVDPNAKAIKGLPKFKYIYVFDKKLRKKVGKEIKTVPQKRTNHIKY